MCLLLFAFSLACSVFISFSCFVHPRHPIFPSPVHQTGSFCFPTSTGLITFCASSDSKSLSTIHKKFDLRRRFLSLRLVTWPLFSLSANWFVGDGEIGCRWRWTNRRFALWWWAKAVVLLGPFDGVCIYGGSIGEVCWPAQKSWVALVCVWRHSCNETAAH